MPTLKVLSPENFRVGSADGLVPPAGNNPCCILASGTGTPRGPRPCRAWHWEHVVTREIWVSVRRRRAPVNKCKQRGRGRRCWEVGAIHTSDDARSYGSSKGVAVWDNACSPYGCVSSRWKSCPGSCLFTQVVITDSWGGDRPWASSVVKVPGAWRKHRWSSRWGEQLCRP